MTEYLGKGKLTELSFGQRDEKNLLFIGVCVGVKFYILIFDCSVTLPRAWHRDHTCWVRRGHHRTRRWGTSNTSMASICLYLLLCKSLVDSVPRPKSRHADQHLLVLQVSALLSGDQKDLEMEFGRFGRTLGCSAPCSLLSREQLTRRNCALLRGAHCCVDLINLPNNVSVERQNLCWRSAVWLLVDARLKVYKLHRESCGLREKLWIWRDWGCSVSPEWCYCQTGIWRCGCCKQVRSTETQVSLPMWTVLLGCK